MVPLIFGNSHNEIHRVMCHQSTNLCHVWRIGEHCLRSASGVGGLQWSHACQHGRYKHVSIQLRESWVSSSHQKEGCDVERQQVALGEICRGLCPTLLAQLLDFQWIPGGFSALAPQATAFLWMMLPCAVPRSKCNPLKNAKIAGERLW